MCTDCCIVSPCVSQQLKEYLERALDMLVDTNTTDAVFDAHDSAGRVEGPESGTGGGGGGGTGESSPLGSASAGHSGFGNNPGSFVNTPASPPTLSSAAALQQDGTRMSLLLRPPAIPLNIESTCMALNERIVAAESCCFIAMVLTATPHLLRRKFVLTIPLRLRWLPADPARAEAQVSETGARGERGGGGQLRPAVPARGRAAAGAHLSRLVPAAHQIQRGEWNSGSHATELH